MLRTTGQTSVDVERTAAFAFLQDAQRLAACIPGCHDLRQISAGRYAAVLTSRVAFMSLSFKVDIEITRIEAPQIIEAAITGDAVGLAGHVVATAGMDLVAESANRTTIRYATDIALTGKLGGLGESVFRATSTQLARQFGDNLKNAIEARRTETPA